MWAQPTGTALVRQAPDVQGKIEGSVQVMEPDDVTLSGGAKITGDLLVPGTPSVRLSGNPTYAGTLDGTGAPMPTKHRVTLNGSVELRNIVRRTNAVALPVVPAPPSPNGTRKVTLRRASDSVGDFATLKDLTLDGDIGLVAIPPGTYGTFSTKGGDDDDDDEGGGSASSNGFTLGIAGASQPAIYNFQKLSLSGKGTLRIVGPVIVTLKDKLSTGGRLGSAARPDWLKLRFSKGDLTLLGGAAVFAHLELPEGTLKLNGNTQFNGAVAVKKLTINGQSILRLLALTSNQPPTVELTAPLDGATFEAPTTITLTATASDADGTIASVEFYRGSTKIGTATASPYAFAWTDVAVGLYELTARAIDNAGASTISTAVNVQVTSSTLPFIANFETTEGYRLG
ncbi:MAG: Ig-like domain-containing protein, partial [Candidatus Didemnitutus sp.]|nr:Ig-like domain-containing protein [Candidatus Didemnitutus sp.]